MTLFTLARALGRPIKRQQLLSSSFILVCTIFRMFQSLSVLYFASRISQNRFSFCSRKMFFVFGSFLSFFLSFFPVWTQLISAFELAGCCELLCFVWKLKVSNPKHLTSSFLHFLLSIKFISNCFKRYQFNKRSIKDFHENYFELVLLIKYSKFFLSLRVCSDNNGSLVTMGWVMSFLWLENPSWDVVKNVFKIFLSLKKNIT